MKTFGEEADLLFAETLVKEKFASGSPRTILAALRPSATQGAAMGCRQWKVGGLSSLTLSTYIAVLSESVQLLHLCCSTPTFKANQ
jgi:hypothetical protein